MKYCINCEVESRTLSFNNCVQKAEVGRITFFHIWHEVIHFFTHAEKGFFYTTGQLIIKPGIVVTKYIKGSQVKYQPPVSYFLIWNAVYILLLYITTSSFGENVALDFTNYFGFGEKTKFVISHLNFVLLALLPFQALYVWLVLTNRRYNYFESLVVVLYSIGTLMLWQCAFVLLTVIIHLLSGFSVHILYSDLFKVVYAS